MPPISPFCSKISIPLNLDGSVTNEQMDGGTDQQRGGPTLFYGCNDASENFTDSYPPTCAQVQASKWLHTHQ